MNIDEGKITLEYANKLLPISKWNTILYIGIHPNTFGLWKGDYFLKKINSINKDFVCDIIDKNNEYLQIAIKLSKNMPYRLNFVHYDIYNFVDMCISENRRYNCIIWWHGPEHMEKEKSFATIKKIESICDLIILGYPNGNSPYNDGEDKHKCILYEQDFKSKNFKTIIFDRKYKNQVTTTSALKLINLCNNE